MQILPNAHVGVLMKVTLIYYRFSLYCDLLAAHQIAWSLYRGSAQTQPDFLPETGWIPIPEVSVMTHTPAIYWSLIQKMKNKMTVHFHMVTSISQYSSMFNSTFIPVWHLFVITL